MDSWNKDLSHKHDDYWRLQEYADAPRLIRELRSELSDRGYATPDKLSRQDAIHHLQRTDRGLKSYHGMATDELRGLVKARKIDSVGRCQGESKVVRTKIITALEAADRSRKFEMFFRLPPELRNRVYGYYFEDLKQPIYAPSQPPLTKACRQIRKESLSMFYSTSSFLLSFPTYEPWWDRIRSLIMPNQLALFIHNTPSSSIAAIQDLTIRAGGSIERGCVPRETTFFTMRIKLAAEGSDFEIECSAGTSFVPANPQKVVSARENVEAVVARIVSREGKHRLMKDDVYDLRRAVEGPFKT